MKSLYFFSFLLTLLSVIQIQAQALVLSRVLDSKTNNPVSKALVRIQGTDQSTQTNAAGYFQLELNLTDTLIVEHEDYQSGMIKVPSLTGFKILLESTVDPSWTKVDTDTQKGYLDVIYKVGVWEYYDEPGVLALKVNYDTGELVYLSEDKRDYVIEIDGKWRSQTLDIYPRYLGSIKEYYSILQESIIYPGKAIKKQTAGNFYISFVIDTTGQLVNPEIVNDIGDGCGDAVLESLELVPNAWTVAMKEGKKYPSRFLLPVSFELSVDGRKVRRSGSKNKRIRPPKGRKLDELVIKHAVVSQDH